jgi:transcriptional regulator with XRE-family HTH domain
VNRDEHPNDVRAREDLVSFLIEVRIEQGLRQKDVAERVGRTQKWASAVETMQYSPELATLQAYARALGYGLLIMPMLLRGGDSGVPD